MTISNRRIPPNMPDDWLYRRIQELERRVNQLETSNSPTIPTYDWDNPPDDPVEGQVALFINTPDLPLTASTDLEASYYFLSTTASGPLSAYTSYPFDSTSLATGSELLDVSDESNPFVKKDGIYTWHFECLFITSDTGTAPHFPTAGDFKGNSAYFVFPFNHDWGTGDYPNHEHILSLENWDGDGSSTSWPTSASSFRLPMKANDIMGTSFVYHDVAGADPLHRFMRGASVNLILLWEPLDNWPTDIS